jgi:hypothetical protein
MTIIGKRLKQFGFDPRPKGQSFRKKTSFGFCSFHLAFIDHADDFDVTADLAIRFDNVEKWMVGEQAVPKTKTRESSTIGGELGNIKGTGQLRWAIEKDNDVSKAADSIMEEFEQVAIPYFDTYSNLDNVLDVLSRDDREVWVHSPIDGERAKAAVAVAFLQEGKEAAKQLGHAKLLYLAERRDFSLESFRTFIRSKGLEVSTMVK